MTYRRLGGFLVLFALLFLSGPPTSALAEGRWFVSLFGGEVGYGSLGDTLIGKLRFNDNHHFVSAALGKELYTWRNTIRLELEGHAGQHWGSGKSHNEFNAVFVVRWLPFWWDNYVDTSFAVGEGLSYATRIPSIEEEQYEEKTSKWLNYLSFDLEFTSPRPSPWSGFFRIHHRSGVDGLFGDVRGASNALAVGVKYTF